ncbi:MAG TPA: lysoplasmalogenase family protein, partial [Clostridiaceae bacterium]|nr:lysoplasmalogenase family protein [Clostridiaceae bacterium]
FLFLDLSGSDRWIIYSNILKYVSVLLCLANALMTGKDAIEKKDAALLQAAMLVTIAADLFLLFTDYYFLGISIFCLVQIIYIARHSRYSKVHAKKICIAGGSALMAVSFFAVVITGINQKAMVLAGCLYAFLTVCSLHTAFCTVKSDIYPKKAAAQINTGLWLLLLCDISIFLKIVIPFIPFSGFLIWFFYLPSQVLLSLSARK